MPTRMFHPQHGWTHAYDTGEVDKLKAQGWAVEMTPEVVAKAVEYVLLNSGPQNMDSALARSLLPQKKKPGRPPKAK